MPRTNVFSAKFGVMALASLVILLAAGCGSSKPEIVGRWQLTNGNQILNFYKDGTIDIANTGAFGSTQSGTYQFVDDTHLRLAIQGSFGFASNISGTYEIKMNGNTLTLVNAKAESVLYHRHK